MAVGRIYGSRVHDSRYWADVLVAPDARGRGHGRAMVHHLAGLRATAKPLCTRGYVSSEAASFARHLGARPYQTCPAEQVETADADHLKAIRHPATVAGGDVGWEELKRAWVEIYAWVHSDWSPVTPGFEMPLLDGFENDLDLHHTRVVAGPTVRASAFVFLDDPIPVIVAECRTRAEVGGLDLLRTCVRDSLISLATAGISSITFDGHDTDPHFRPLLDEIPRTGEVLELLEWTPKLDSRARH